MTSKNDIWSIFSANNLLVSVNMLLNLPESLPSLVGAKFKAAKASSSLLFSPTEVAIIRTSGNIPVGWSGHVTPACLHE